MTAAAQGGTQIGPQATVVYHGTMVYTVRQVYKEELQASLIGFAASTAKSMSSPATAHQCPPPTLLGDELRDS